MFELEFDIKMKAQLKYMEVKQKRNKRVSALDFLRHEYLWTPTTTFYIGSAIFFLLIRSRLRLPYWQLAPFMILPVTMDYAKREWYVRMIPEKDRKELAERRVLVQQIINEKKKHVSFEQVLRYAIKLNLDKPLDN